MYLLQEYEGLLVLLEPDIGIAKRREVVRLALRVVHGLCDRERLLEVPDGVVVLFELDERQPKVLYIGLRHSTSGTVITCRGSTFWHEHRDARGGGRGVGVGVGGAGRCGSVWIGVDTRVENLPSPDRGN